MSATGTRYVLTLHGWRPATARQLAYPGPLADKLRARDRERVDFEARAASVPKARGRRRVGLHLVVGPRHRTVDLGAYRAGLLDTLVYLGLLLDDTADGCEVAPITFERGTAPRSVITLEELPAA